MLLADERRGIAFLCSADGVIIRIVRDELQLAAGFRAGTPIADLVEADFGASARGFVQAISERGAAFDWPLSVCVDGHSTPMHFAGVAEADHLYVVAARNSEEMAHAAGELILINNEQTNALRTALKELSLNERRRTARDRPLYDDLSRLNNELANLQRDMAKKNAELEKLNTQKNRFLGMAAHDLRSPLGVIYSLSEFLEADGDNLNDEQREFVTTIKETSDFMLRLVSDLLDVASIESGRLILDTQPVDLPGLIRHNLALNRVLAARKNISIEFEPGAAEITAWVDVGKIEQVLTNLLSNALKFSHPDTRVTVTVCEADDVATIEVRDQGPGIPAADVPKLFKFFGKASVRTTAGEQSTGLGLAIVRRIVEAHGGRVWVESEVGVGTAVLFTLPMTPPPLPA